MIQLSGSEGDVSSIEGDVSTIKGDYLPSGARSANNLLMQRSCPSYSSIVMYSLSLKG